ncbi:hypothetical protein B566_EDAN002454 [Ephemera danica]|nr:hypothetical protein B566_EDAN002454 [Ephemera danica]
MATLELEPDFVKGLRFMLSSSRESVESLRSMLDDAIRTKYGSSKSLGSFQHKLKLDEEYTSQILTERNSEDSSSSKEDVEGELNLDMMEEDLACTVCRGMNVGPRNRLVECFECHSLYHQECHRPVIAEQDVSDPRNTWYCSACSRSIHKPTETATSSTGSSKQSTSSSKSSSSSKQTYKSSGQSGSSRDSPTNPKSSSSSSSRSEAASEKSSLFKRTDKVSSGSSSGSSSKSVPAGLAALAASLQPSKSSSSNTSSSHKSSSSSSSGFASGSTSSSKSSSSSKDIHSSSSSKAFSSSSGSSGQSSKGAPSSPTLSGINADRRLQIMKKKAAKLQEKRKHSK